MSARERILAIRLFRMQEKAPALAADLGIAACLTLTPCGRPSPRDEGRPPHKTKSS